MIEKFVMRTPAATWNLALLQRLLLMLRWISWGLAGLVAATALLVLVQLAYPRSLTRPFTRLDDQSVSFWRTDKLTSLAQTEGVQPYKLMVSGHAYKMEPSTLGVSLDAQGTASEALSYSWPQRLVPLSLFIHQPAKPLKKIDGAKLSSGLAAFAAARASDATDASLKKDSSGIYEAVLPGKNGSVIDTEKLTRQILAADFGDQLAAPLKTVPPAISQTDLQSTLDDWRRQTDNPISVVIGGQPVSVGSDLLRQWVSIATDVKQDKVFVSYDQQAIEGWLNDYTDSVYVAPQPAVTYLQDGSVTANTGGQTGSTIDNAATTADIITAVQAGGRQRTATVVMKSIPIPTQDIRSYSPTSKGLQALLNDWSGQYGGSLAVSLQEVGGLGRSASLNPDKKFFTASIYKLWVADYIYKQMEQGDISLSLTLANNQTVDQCLEKMIVVSDNDCAIEMGDQFGWNNINDLARQQGFNSTSIVNLYWSTTTSDTAKFLQQLNAGSLLSSGDTSALLDKMNRQIYRSAIPAGSAGSTVDDKVGFYSDYWHDAAIVKSPQATYVLVVFTEGTNAGAGAIKNLAAQVQQTFNQ